MTVIWIALAGSVGAIARFVVDGSIRARWPSEFPGATMLINVSGSLLLGVVTGLVLFQGCPGALRLIVGTGFCGGYTTFSTASFETVRLIQRRAPWPAIGNAVGTVALTVATGGLGLAMVL